MKNVRKTLVLISFVLVLFLIPTFVNADIGPKPTMNFSFVNDSGKSFKITGGEQCECSDNQGENCEVLQKVGPQSFSCETDSCSSSAYGYKDYHKLVITFEDKTRESNVFKTSKFSSEYKVHIRENDLFIEGSSVSTPTKNLGGFTTALIVSIIVELLGMIVIVFAFKMPKRLLLEVVLANLISIALFWFVITSFVITFLVWVGVFELMIVLFEALFYFFITKKQISFKKALLISLVLNIFSFGIGLII